MTGPTVRSPDGLVDLTPNAERYGLRGQIMADQNLWNNTCKLGGDAEIALIDSLVNGMDKLLSGDRADYDNFDFKHWYRKTAASTKADWTRVRATMFATDEGTPWICLTESPKRAHRWRGHSHD
jgi:hypothetical protein